MSARASVASASIGAVGVLPGLSRRVRAVMAVTLALCVLQPAVAQQRQAAFAFPYSGTLKQINASGVVVIGHRQNSPPFAFLDKKGKPIGYSLDLCEIVVEQLIAELGKDVRVAYRPVTPENRLDLVSSGEIDLECGSTTNSAERRKLVAYSPTILDVVEEHMARKAAQPRDA